MFYSDHPRLNKLFSGVSEALGREQSPKVGPKPVTQGALLQAGWYGIPALLFLLWHLLEEPRLGKPKADGRQSPPTGHGGCPCSNVYTVFEHGPTSSTAVSRGERHCWRKAMTPQWVALPTARPLWACWCSHRKNKHQQVCRYILPKIPLIFYPCG